MAKYKELQKELERRAGITLKESDSAAQEIMDLKRRLEGVRCGLRESFSVILEKRAGINSKEGLAGMTKTRAGVRSGDVVSRIRGELEDRAELRESGTAVLSDETVIISLREAKYNPDVGQLVTILEGVSPSDAPLLSRTKMYLNKPTHQERRERPEGSLKDWMSTITEAWAEDSKVHARIAVHDNWLAERLSDSIAAKHLKIEVNMKSDPIGIYWLAN